MAIDVMLDDEPLNDEHHDDVKADNGVKVDDDPVDLDDQKSNDTDSKNTPKNDDDKDDKPAHDLDAGTELEIDGKVYTVSDNGDIVDKDGKVFKEAKDVKAFLEENQPEDDDEEITIDSISNYIGLDIKDENGNKVEFANTPQGVKEYVDAVIATKADDIAQGSVNKLFQDNPLLKQFIDYVKITGTPRGFGDIPDRSGIVLDKDNEEQLSAVIRMAAQEFGNASMDEAYIDFLKTSGRLYDTAKAQLDVLVNKDKQIRKDIETQAAKAREEELAELNEYWNGVNNAIKNRQIGEYRLPETIVRERNGQKITYTLDDFYDYVSNSSEQDEDGNRITGYQRDLNNLSDEEHLNRELLDAWLMWTGGSYKDLIEMRVKEEQVKRLVINSKKNRSKGQVKITKPKKSSNPVDVVLD